MEYGYGLMIALSVNKINFEETQKEWDKPSLTTVLFSKLVKKIKKSK